MPDPARLGRRIDGIGAVLLSFGLAVSGQLLVFGDALDDQPSALELRLQAWVAGEELPPEVGLAKRRIEADPDTPIFLGVHASGKPLEFDVELLLTIVGQPVRF